MTKTTLIIRSEFVKIINKLIIQNQIRLLWKTNGYKQTKARNRKNRDKRMITFKFILTYLSFYYQLCCPGVISLSVMCPCLFSLSCPRYSKQLPYCLPNC